VGVGPPREPPPLLLDPMLPCCNGMRARDRSGGRVPALAGDDAELAERRERHARVERDLQAVKARYVAMRSPVERMADRMIGIAGSTAFLVVHALWFIVWILWNVGAFGFDPVDRFPFGFLTTAVSLEAIFLSILVLLSQNRDAMIAELREEVTLEIDTRTEEEVTKILQLVTGLYGRLGIPLSDDEELRRMLRPLDKDALEIELRDQIANAKAAPRRRKERAPRGGAEGGGPGAGVD
jgi:uncharacterized membrane protein